MKAATIRNDEKNIHHFRFIVQILFSLLCIWIGVEFYWFIRYLESGGTASFYERPPGVDGFLPISSLMNVYLFFVTGEIHPAHPFGFFIFITIAVLSIVFGKSFCSWLCPVGSLSEYLGNAGEKLFSRKTQITKWLDYPLRSLKYLMFGYLAYIVFWVMTPLDVRLFLDGPYNLIADIKMYYFFANLTSTGLIVIGTLFIVSLFVRNFWCRYLCPYGAFLGITSLISPIKIQRNTATCIDCGLCSKACPSLINVDKVRTVISDECTTCLQCADACPVKDTLQLNLLSPKKTISKRWVAIGIIVLFLTGTGLGKLTKKWQNKISKEEYLEYYQRMNQYGHPESPR